MKKKIKYILKTIYYNIINSIIQECTIYAHVVTIEQLLMIIIYYTIPTKNKFDHKKKIGKRCIEDLILRFPLCNYNL